MTRYASTDQHCQMRHWQNVSTSDMHTSESIDQSLEALVNDLMTLDVPTREQTMFELDAGDVYPLEILYHHVQRRLVLAKVKSIIGQAK